MRKFLFFALLALPVGNPTGFAFSSSPPPCHDTLVQTPSGKILVDQPRPVQRGQAGAVVASWSTDFLLEATRDLIQLPAPCQKDWAALREQTRALYLKRLGAPGKDLSWFKALVSVDSKEIARRLSPPIQLSQVYRHQAQVEGVWIFSQKPIDTKPWKKTLATVCPTFPCAFWHPDFVFRTLVVEPRGLAAYVPETATLTLSKAFFESQPPSAPAVHELVHAAVRFAQWRKGQDWKGEFERISGWHRKEPKTWIEAGSPQNGIRVGDTAYEGFCYARSFEHSQEVQDSEEDLADHGAAYFTDPRCFCQKGKLKLPQKWLWLAAHFPPRPRPCP